jgi:hypothetical protein
MRADSFAHLDAGGGLDRKVRAAIATPKTAHANLAASG